MHKVLPENNRRRRHNTMHDARCMVHIAHSAPPCPRRNTMAKAHHHICWNGHHTDAVRHPYQSHDHPHLRPDLRFFKSNGGFGEPQLAWLKGVLTQVIRARVVARIALVVGVTVTIMVIVAVMVGSRLGDCQCPSESISMKLKERWR